MKIVYVAGCVSEAAYARLYGNPKSRPVFQAQKYNRLFIEGLAAHTQVEVVGYPPVDEAAMESGVISIPDETVGNVHYHYIRTYRHPLRRRLHVGIHSFIKCLKLLDRNSAVMIDCLNQMSGLGALLASKLRRCQIGRAGGPFGHHHGSPGAVFGKEKREACLPVRRQYS